jgi:HEAT repeat protein
MLHARRYLHVFLLLVFAGCSGSTNKNIRDLNSTDLHTRAVAVGNLTTKKDDPATVQKVIDLLKSDNERLVMAAIEILGDMRDMKDQSNVKALAVMAASDSVPYRLETIKSFGKIGGDPVVPFVVNALQDPSDSVRYAATLVMGIVHPQDKIEYVYKMLEDKRPYVRAAAVQSLYRYGFYVKDSGVRAADFTPALSDSFTIVRYVGVQALGRPYPDSTMAKNMLVGALEDQDMNVRIEAIRSLAKIQCRQAVSELEEIHDFEPYPVGEEIVTALNVLKKK